MYVGCAYYLDDEFNRMIENKSIENNFSLIHINARILPTNLDHLDIYLTSLSHMFSVIAVTETWANFTNESLLIIPGYNSIFKNRLKGRGDGVALFVRQSLTYSVRNDLGVFDNEDRESVFIELNDINFGRKIVDAIYRPPGNCIDMFMSSLESIMLIISNSKHDCLISGDWNIDLLKYDVHLGTESFVNNLRAKLHIPVITRPTRFSEFSSTLIDNILNNKPQDLQAAEAIICDITDHLPIFFVSEEMQKKLNKTIPLHYTE